MLGLAYVGDRYLPQTTFPNKKTITGFQGDKVIKIKTISKER